MAQSVKVVGAPGYVDEFRAKIVPGLQEFRVADDQEPVTVVMDKGGDIHVVPSRCVQFTEEA